MRLETNQCPGGMCGTAGPSLLCFPSRFGSDPSRYVVRVGASTQTLSPEQVVIHRKFKGQSGGHDLALLKLPSTKGQCLTFGPNTNAVCLPVEDTAPGGSPSSCVVMVTASWTRPGMFFFSPLSKLERMTKCSLMINWLGPRSLLKTTVQTVVIILN